MNKQCGHKQPIQPYQIYLGLITLFAFCVVMIGCQRSGAQRVKNKKKIIKELNQKSKQSVTSWPKMNEKMPQISIDSQIRFQSAFKGRHQDVNEKKGPKIFLSSRNENIVKELTDISYDYKRNEHKILKKYRRQQDIQKQRELYLKRQYELQEPIIQPTTKQAESKKQTGIKRNQSFLKLQDLKKQEQEQQEPIDLSLKQNPENVGKQKKQEQLKSDKQQINKSNQPKASTGPIFGGIDLGNSFKNGGGQGFLGSNTNNSFLFGNNNQKPEVPSANIQPPKQQSEKKPQQNPQKPNTTTQINQQQKKQPTKQPVKPSQPSVPKDVKKQAQDKKQKQPAKQQQTKITPAPVPVPVPAPTATVTQPIKTQVKQIKKITTSQQYLDAIIKYSQKFALKTEINTKIGNLDGARSDPVDLWQFTTSYITTIDTKNDDQLVTFTYKIWHAIVHKFMKNTNIKDGFQKIPPKQRNKQVYKNQINTYVLFITIYRVLGYQQIWLGVLGKTLKMLEFLFKRKQVIKQWKKLDLIQNQYVSLDGNVGEKYLTRIDFLTYFLLALTTFDPIQAFEQIAGKTGENYPFLVQLKRTKYKWSYRQFWCLVETMRKNKFQGYFKIPFWNNTLSVIYLPMLKNLKQGQMKQFVSLSKWIYKECKQLVKKIDNAQQSKVLNEQNLQEKGYQFDGEQFICSVKSLGKGMQTRERQMKSNRWEDFRDRCSVLYFFWRIST